MPKLFVVATPIGNLDDLSPRMKEALRKNEIPAVIAENPQAKTERPD